MMDLGAGVDLWPSRQQPQQQPQPQQPQQQQQPQPQQPQQQQQSELPFICTDCDVRFSSYRLLSFHIETHTLDTTATTTTPITPITTVTVEKRLEDDHSLTSDMEMHTLGTATTHSLDTTTTTELEGGLNEGKGVEAAGSLNCEMCGIPFLNISALAAHIAQQHLFTQTAMCGVQFQDPVNNFAKFCQGMEQQWKTLTTNILSPQKKNDMDVFHPLKGKDLHALRPLKHSGILVEEKGSNILSPHKENVLNILTQSKKQKENTVERKSKPVTIISPKAVESYTLIKTKPVNICQDCGKCFAQQHLLQRHRLKHTISKKLSGGFLSKEMESGVSKVAPIEESKGYISEVSNSANISSSSHTTKNTNNNNNEVLNLPSLKHNQKRGRPRKDSLSSKVARMVENTGSNDNNNSNNNDIITSNNNNNINSNNNYNINSDNNVNTSNNNNRNNINSEINNNSNITTTTNNNRGNDTKLNNDNNCIQNISSNSITADSNNNSQVLKSPLITHCKKRGRPRKNAVAFHLANPKYSCVICNRSFGLKRNLTIHICKKARKELPEAAPLMREKKTVQAPSQYSFRRDVKQPERHGAFTGEVYLDSLFDADEEKLDREPERELDVELSEAAQEDVPESSVVKETTVKKTASSTSPAAVDGLASKDESVITGCETPPLFTYSVNLNVMGRCCSFDYINGPEGVETVLANAGFNINPKVYVVPLKVKVLEKEDEAGPEKGEEEKQKKDEQPCVTEVISAKQIKKEVNNERPECSQCDRSFTCRPHLLRHIREVHIGIRRAICPFCKYAFSRDHDLKRHLQLNICKNGGVQQQKQRHQRQQQRQQQQQQRIRNVSVAMDIHICKGCRISFKSGDYLSSHRCSGDGCL